MLTFFLSIFAMCTALTISYPLTCTKQNPELIINYRLNVWILNYFFCIIRYSLTLFISDKYNLHFNSNNKSKSKKFILKGGLEAQEAEGFN